jgi:hypothetical protein
MEETSIRDSINLGKANWQQMQKRLLKEADQIGGSDIPATQPTGGGVVGGVKDTMANVGKVASEGGATKEFENIKNKLNYAISDTKAKYVKDNANRITKLNTQSVTLEDIIMDVEDTIKSLESERQKNELTLNKIIKDYNEKAETSLKQALGTMGLKVESYKIPEIKSLNDFLNFAILYTPIADSHIINDIFTKMEPISEKNLLAAQLSEAKRGINVENPVAATDKEGGIRPDPSLQKIKGRIPNKFDEVVKVLSHDIKNALLVMGKIEVINALGEGFTKKLQRLNATKSSKDAAQAKRDAEIIVLDPKDFGVSPEEPTQSLEENKVVPRMKAGPGKIAEEVETQDESKLDEQVNSFAKNKEHLKESWSKVAGRSSKPSKDVKPDDFTLLMG